jgi:inosine-uridine nucleoside N-ribohydrolase
MPLRPIIIDTDPGQDDAVALLMAMSARDPLKVIGITTCACNVSLELTTANALRIVELAERADIPVRAGCPRPIMRPLVTAPEIHGETGLAGTDLPAPRTGAQKGHGVFWLIETLLAAPEPITVCTLGPMTNLAVALIMEPRIAGRIAEIVSMGGAFSGGNVMPSAEFNIFVDPEAASIVLGCGRPITLIPLDCTYQVRALPHRLAAISGIGTRAATVVAQIMSYRATSEGGAGRPLHDACVIAYLLGPGIFSGPTVPVQVETASELTRGTTVMDRRGRSGLPANCRVLIEADAEGFFGLLGRLLERLP